MTKYWMAVASLEHVSRGIVGGFAQVCHGKAGPLKNMNANDWIIYYSPTVKFGQKEPCQSFTAIGKIVGDEPYEYAMSQDFIPWRIDVDFIHAKPVTITPLIDKLEFIQDKKRWGYPFRRGCFSISKNDFLLISKAMEIHIS